MSKYRSSDKKQRKSITLEEKLDVIRRYEHSKCIVDISNAVVVHKLTSRTIRKQAEKTGRL
jgi:hypothetical protein